MPIRLGTRRKTETRGEAYGRNRPGWRQYQSRLQRQAALSRSKRRLPFYLALLAAAVLIVYGSRGDSRPAPPPGPSPAPPQHRLPDPARFLNKKEVQELLGGRTLLNAASKDFEVHFAGQPIWVETTFDAGLQRYLVEHLDSANARYIAIVALEPHTGRVLAMAGLDKIHPENNPCIDNIFPAASLFKIVTAAAAIEEFDLHAESAVTFNGGRYTLYKSQLSDRVTRYTHHTTLQESFALSINPVFGKLGSNRLGGDILAAYAKAFGFNQPIAFEVPLAPSLFSVTDEPYHWAELACGFNRKTTLSPLHAALLAATVANGGQLVQPTVVARVTDDQGRSLYHSGEAHPQQVIAARTSAVIREMMHATVRSGTGSKLFRGHRRDPTLGRLYIGGKTGSIDSRSHEVRLDWFAGFAHEREGDEAIAIAALVAHEDFIGTRAGEYVRMAIKHYFDNYFTRAQSASKKSSKG
jgi:cell division protein FtsI/penicillin-binding protein 2